MKIIQVVCRIEKTAGYEVVSWTSISNTLQGKISEELKKEDLITDKISIQRVLGFGGINAHFSNSE